MGRPQRFEHQRYLGDKRIQVVYDLDNPPEGDVIDELVASEAFATFGPDTLVEASNRGYRADDAALDAARSESA
ncbi:MAG: hypothetical protein M5U31_01895 [Acidimicrobiia bacterium]|nr:hypothetical protein [Acidimicrobiia bacterium]